MYNGDGRTFKVMAPPKETRATAEAIVQARFQRSPYLPLQRITCCLDDRVLVLRGRVPTYYLKQLAQTIGSTLGGVRQIVNELHVDFPEGFRTNS